MHSLVIGFPIWLCCFPGSAGRAEPPQNSQPQLIWLWRDHRVACFQHSGAIVGLIALRMP
jgi:hypothetical protein